MSDNVKTDPKEIDSFSYPIPKIKVLGLGGGGSNAVNRMIELGLSGVEYIAANTDAQALKDSLADRKIQLGPYVTRGLGAGGDPRIGEAAAEESEKEIRNALSGADMVFLTAGMGGGTGTGAIPVAARISKALGAVTIGIVTTPFSFEIGRRQKNSQDGLAKLWEHTHTLITVPNDRLLKIAARDLPLELAFRLADDILRQGIQGITQLVTQPGMINVDFSHVRNLMLNGGGSLLAIGYGQGTSKALQAVKQALNHPLLESIHLENANGIIANFTGSEDLTFMEVAEALTYLKVNTNEDSEIIPGVNSNDCMQDRVEVILVITGLGGTPVNNKLRGFQIEKPSPRTRPQTADAQKAQSASAVTGEDNSMVEAVTTSSSTDYDIPAFMRRRYKS
jgi:cell division protein FtsZ